MSVIEGTLEELLGEYAPYFNEPKYRYGGESSAFDTSFFVINNYAFKRRGEKVQSFVIDIQTFKLLCKFEEQFDVCCVGDNKVFCWKQRTTKSTNVIYVYSFNTSAKGMHKIKTIHITKPCIHCLCCGYFEESLYVCIKTPNIFTISNDGTKTHEIILLCYDTKKYKLKATMLINNYVPDKIENSIKYFEISDKHIFMYVGTKRMLEIKLIEKDGQWVLIGKVMNESEVHTYRRINFHMLSSNSFIYTGHNQL